MVFDLLLIWESPPTNRKLQNNSFSREKQSRCGIHGQGAWLQYLNFSLPCLLQVPADIMTDFACFVIVSLPEEVMRDRKPLPCSSSSTEL